MHKVTSLALGSVFFLSCFPAAGWGAEATPTAPLPSAQYAAWNEDSGPSEQAAEADAGKENAEGDLDFLNKDLSEIARTQVTSPALSAEIDTVSRTTQPLARTPSAVYVVTNEMIRRCGARNIPEVLRTVPGVQVSRINASAWAISIRGFSSRFSNKLLVQIDGVAIYSPSHSGVFWEREYVMLEDVDRIEVIRGPGAAVWGSNAMNGVINIVTKSSKDTHGVYAVGGGGTEHKGFGDFRVGGHGGNLHWRAYGMAMKDDNGFAPLGATAQDATRMSQGGFRMDWTPTLGDTFTLQGDFYDGLIQQDGWASIPPFFYNRPLTCDTTTFLMRWTRQVDEDTDWAVQLYYWNPCAKGYNINQVGTFDLDFQHHLKRGRHDFVWGAGYRNSAERWIQGSGPYAPFDSEQIPSYFVQDTITLVDDRFYATFGSKFDNNSVTHFEYQPTARVAWTPDERTSIWASISRASRTPSLIERMVEIPRGEHLLAYEVGIRRQPTDRFFWEVATFFNRYNNLIGYYGSISNRICQNAGRADNYGIEINATYEVNKRWHLTAWYAFLVEDVDYPANYTPVAELGGSARNKAYVQSSWDLGRNVSFDAMLRYVDSLAVAPGFFGFYIGDYVAADLRLAWRPSEQLEMAVVGQNLLSGKHLEYTYVGGSYPTAIEPGVYGSVSWRY